MMMTIIIIIIQNSAGRAEFSLPIWLWSPFIRTFNRYRGARQPEREYNALLSSAEVKIAWNFNTTPCAHATKLPKITVE
jgi:hypothetical protein